MMKRKNSNGFTMVELLAVIVILGILSVISIAAIQGVLAKARKEYYVTQKNNMVMAAQSYLNANKRFAPKVSGQYVTVDLGTLISNKYIDQVVDYNKKPCDGSLSHVQAFKYEDDIYYTSLLICPDHDDNESIKDIKPNINISFDGELTGAKAILNIDGGFELVENDKKNYIPLISYKYTIYKGSKLLYQSDDIDANKSTTTQIKTISLKNYVPGDIKVTVTASNIYGYSNTYSLSSNDKFKDLIKPEPGVINGESAHWTRGNRIVTVQCIDNDSGCEQTSYTDEFNGDKRKGIIHIFDQEGNVEDVEVDVYIDNTPPLLTLNVYKRDKDGKKEGDSIQEFKTSKGEQNKSVVISKDTVNGWLNREKYPYGVYLEATYKDVSEIKNLEWKWNDSGLVSTSSNAKVIPDSNKKVEVPDQTEGKYSFSLSGEGWRYGVISVTDSVDFTTSIEIVAPIDRTAPSRSTNGESNVWTKDNRTININCSDALSGCVKNTESLTFNSTTKTSNHSISDNAGNTVNSSLNVYVDKTAPNCGPITGGSTTWTKDNRTVSVSCNDANSGCSVSPVSKVFNTTTKEGTITIADAVGNTRNCPVNAYVDKTGPTCGKITGGSTTWTKNDRNISVDCSDAHSGCSKTSFSNKFTSNTKVGIITLTDKLGNATNCNVNVYIDKTVPKKKNSDGESTNWTSGDRKITVNCDDGGESGCKPVTKTYNSTTKTDTITLIDGAGNSTSVTVNVYVDKTKPSCGKVSGDSTSWTKNNRTISVACSDSHSGCTGSGSKTFTSTTKTGTVQIKDNAGNTKDCSVNVYVDKTPPAVKATDGPKAQKCSKAAGVSVTYEVSDAHSGITYVGDWWGFDSSFSASNALKRYDSNTAISNFSKTHNWSSKCRTVNSPAGYCYVIKVYAKDKVGNETKYVSPTCAYKGG